MILKRSEEAKALREEVLVLLRTGKVLNSNEITTSIFRITDIQLQMLFEVAESNDALKRSLDEIRISRKETSRTISEIVERERKRQISPIFLKVTLCVLGFLATCASSMSGYVLSELNATTRKAIILKEKVQAIEMRQSTSEEQIRFILRKDRR